MGERKGKGKASAANSSKRRHLLAADPAQSFNPKASRAKSLQSREDAFGGDEDDFHSNRDQVYFNEGSGGRNDDEELSEDDEVFGLNLPSDVESDEDEAEIEDDDDEEEEEEEEEEEQAPEAPEAPRGRFAKPTLLQSTTADDDASDASSNADSEDEEEAWGANAYHATRKAPGEADSDDEEALTLEAEEARRLQAKARAVLVAEDFGAGDEEEDLDGELEKEREKFKLEDDAEVSASKSDERLLWSEEQCIAELVKTSPETLALVDDLGPAVERLLKAKEDVQTVRKAEGEDGGDHPALAILELEYQALATYVPTLLFYFSLMLTPSPSSDLVDKVLARLAGLRRSLATMDELNLTSSGPNLADSDDDNEEDSEDDDGSDDDELMQDASQLWDQGDLDEEGSSDEDMGGMLNGLSDGELEEVMGEVDDDATAEDLMEKVKARQEAKAGGASLSSLHELLPAPPTNGKPTKEKKNKKQKGIIIPDLPPLAVSRRDSSSTKQVNDDFLEPTSLSKTDQTDKASKRHTLRFHVSQVHQKSVKREQGSGRRVGGDDDLPRRSKERSRAEVLKRQEHGGRGGEALDGEEWGETDKREAREVRGEAEGEEGEDGYYELVKSGREEEKANKKRKYDEERREEKNALDSLSAESPAGPRGATYKIMSNKGLTPKRAKANRNPRVKKRMMYDKAVKKVATMKSVYKGGLGGLEGGEYKGEKSGIGRVVKSVKLGQ